MMRHVTNEFDLLRTSVTRSEAGALLYLDGRLTIDSAPHLRNQMLGILYEESLANLTLDFSNVPHMDCAGIATLLEGLKIARVRNIRLTLTGLHDRPFYLLEVTGLLSLFGLRNLTFPTSV